MQSTIEAEIHMILYMFSYVYRYSELLAESSIVIYYISISCSSLTIPMVNGQIMSPDSRI